ncbi:MAG: alpha-glucosidase [Blautia sp.]|nr:alpha-glucosidase [Blautia sp.]
MIRRYQVGEMLMDTGAVVGSYVAGEGFLPGWKLVIGEGTEGVVAGAEAAKTAGSVEAVEEHQGFTLTYPLAEEEKIFGLGETIRGMDKRGWLYTSFNVDDPIHLPGKHSLYASHNFLLFVKKDGCFGLFVDNPGQVDFDLGYSHTREAKIYVHEGGADLYLVEEESPIEVVRAFRRLIGKSYEPPRWAFGFGQSRWSYFTADEVREVAVKHREAGIPLDMIYLDIDYMDSYKDFTVDTERFGDLKALVQDMKEMGIHLVPIIDAGVKMEEGYSVYEEGVEKGYFCKKEDGSLLVAAVWPGRVHFPDFLKAEAAAWFGDQYQFLLDMGIDGFWNDMNEPAIFYTEDHLKEVFEKIEDYKGKNLDISAFFSFRNLIGTISNYRGDYERFYHEVGEKKLRHDTVHNLYGAKMTQAAGEAFERMGKKGEVLLFSRSSYIGSHRYGGVWTGDNKSWWSHLLLNLQQLPGLNMCGYLYSGADIGGFGDDCTEELLLRWLALGVFTPLFRNHSALGTRRQEFYAFENEDAYRNIVRLRYELLPYLPMAFDRAVEEDSLLFSPLGFVYQEDERAWEIEDEVMLGEEILLAPVYQPHVHGRMVYLPEEMLYVRVSKGLKEAEKTPMSAGDHYVPLKVGEVGFFLRKGYAISYTEAAECVRDAKKECEVLSFEGKE